MPSFETSKPVGAVATKLSVKLAPETGNCCAVEAVPKVVVNGVVVAAPVIVGTAIVGVTDAQEVPILNSSNSIDGVALVESCLKKSLFTFNKSVPPLEAER